MGLTHFDNARTFEYELGHSGGAGRCSARPAGSRTVGVRRIQLPPGCWSTPAHEHGRSEEIFYVLAGRGISWQAGRTAEIRAGDGILYAPRRGAHTIRADEELDLLAFGTREYDESLRLPRLELSLVGSRGVHSVPGVLDGVPLQFAREAEQGPPELPDEPGPRPTTIANLDELEPVTLVRPARGADPAQLRPAPGLGALRAPARRRGPGQGVDRSALPLRRGGDLRHPRRGRRARPRPRRDPGAARAA